MLFKIEIDNKTIMCEGLLKCRKLVYKKYKNNKSIKVTLYINNKEIDVFTKNERGFLESQNGYPLYI